MDNKMKKIEIYNEIVLLRQSVRQARICVINKLIREAKRLRACHGNEKQLEKNKNKADKLLREVFALKHIKDDEISKFGIVSFEDLKDVLQNPNTADGTRAMAKLVRYKSLSSRIIEFQEKFPDYDEYISWRRKKHSLKKRGNCSIDFTEKHSKRLKNDSDNNETEKVRKRISKNAEDVIVAAVGSSCQKTSEIDEKCEKLSDINEENTEIKEVKTLKEKKGKSMKILKIHDAEVKSKNSQSCETVTKIVSNEATVKRFREILQETEERNDRCEEVKNQEFCNEEIIKATKKIDDFFLDTDETTSCPNTILFSKEKTTNYTRNIRQDTLKSYRIETKKDKLYDKTVNKERRDNGGQKINKKDIFRDRNSRKETSGTVRWKRNRKDTEIEENIDVRSRNVENESLHPSWVAKKKQQDIMKQGFQGKKIKFHEN